jgi:YD repeat-containing protein
VKTEVRQQRIDGSWKSMVLIAGLLLAWCVTASPEVSAQGTIGGFDVTADPCRNAPANKTTGPDGTSGGEPVDLESGVFTLRRTDLVIPGIIPIVFGETYRSQDNPAGRFGIGASDFYDYRIRAVNGTTAILQLPTNARYQFVVQPDGTYINTNIYWLAGARLYDSGVDGDDRFSLLFKDGSQFVFTSTGFAQLTAIVDANGNQLQFSGDSNGRLAEICQPNGRSVFITYIGESVSIANVSDNDGRTVSYVYDSNNRLVAVPLPRFGGQRSGCMSHEFS